MEYLPVIATTIFVIGFAMIFRALMRNCSEQGATDKTIQQQQTKLFIRTAIVEAVPVLLIVGTFIYGEGVISNITIPLAIIFIVSIFGLIHMFSSFRMAKERMETSSIQKQIQSLFFLSVPLLAAIPIVSIITLIVLSAEA
ncbi:hypothetical protein LGQ02_02240 [Bacillus shivajii]|uniref:hypothetical protein n=1 Tax=Bacillus shivajii TaxID=1983719 RepID=UPI001CFC105A|nr:hypothetical protein [Bacillus shivajii]UCZ53641.1 hypothetical protein LGQ02_02240 [Bacillus shivajii]